MAFGSEVREGRTGNTRIHVRWPAPQRLSWCAAALLLILGASAQADDAATAPPQLIGNTLLNPSSSDAEGGVRFVASATLEWSQLEGGVAVACAATPVARDRDLSRGLSFVCVPGADVAKPRPGARLGYLVGDCRKRPDAAHDVVILNGKATRCPRLGAESPAQPIALGAADAALVGDDDAAAVWAQGGEWRGTPGATVARLLVGNTIFWGRREDGSAGPKTFFNRDGRVYHGQRDAEGRIDYVIASRWKVLDGRFCLQDWREGDAFKACDALALRAPPGGGGLQVYFDHQQESALLNPGFGAEPATVMQGNPAGFAPPNP